MMVRGALYQSGARSTTSERSLAAASRLNSRTATGALASATDTYVTSSASAARTKSISGRGTPELYATRCFRLLFVAFEPTPRYVSGHAEWRRHPQQARIHP